LELLKGDSVDSLKEIPGGKTNKQKKQGDVEETSSIANCKDKQKKK